MRKRTQKKGEPMNKLRILYFFWKSETDPKYEETDPKKGETDQQTEKKEETDPSKQETNQM